MKIVKMSTSSFWKGEAGVKGLVEDQARTYEVSLYLKNDQVRDYSCTCREGNSYKGMCSHGEALFAYYNECRSEAKKPLVHTSSQVHTMIREYTNREVAGILAGEEQGEVRLLPVLVLEDHEVRLEFKLGLTKLYVLRDLAAFSDAVETGAYVEYGKELAFHHQRSAFAQESRPFLTMILDMTEKQKAVRSLTLRKMSRDSFFVSLGEGELEVRLPGKVTTLLKVTRTDPLMALCVEKYGRDGIRVRLEGVVEGEVVRPVLAGFPGEHQLYLVSGGRLYCCGEEFTSALGPFLEQISTEQGGEVYVGKKDIPLFYERVIKNIRPYCRLRLEQVNFEEYKPEPLKAQFLFDSQDGRELFMEPRLSYGGYTFHPVEDENLPRTICRDVPGEFRISQVIGKYFKYKDADGKHLVIRGDEEALYRLFDQGMEEFKSLGEVYLAGDLKDWRVLPPPRVNVNVSVANGWLELSVDTGELSGQELLKILTAYSQKKRFYRLKGGEFLRLGEGGLYTISKLASELGISKKELGSGRIRLPAYRALYLDYMLKQGEGVSYYRDKLFKAVVRGIKNVEDSDLAVPESLREVLREYQKTGFRWLKTLDSCGFGGILADDMGLGKTIQVIALLEECYEQGETRPSLVVCPASLVYNWEHEFGRFAPGLSVQSVAGVSAVREQILAQLKEEPSSWQIIITSYDLLKRDIGLYEEISFRFQIIDEAQYIKNAVTQSARAVKAVRAQTRFALTGTPVENRLGELWSIFDYLMPGFLFGSQHFRKEYELPIVRDNDGETLNRLKRLIGPFVLRRVKQDVLRELPDKLEQVVYASFEEEQRKLYTANAILLKEKLENGGLQEGKDRLQILSELMRLRELCCDPRLCYGGYRGGSAKLETCMDLVKRAVAGEHKILLFSQFTSMLELIEERLKKEEIGSYKLMGATPKEERMRLVGEFQRDNVPVFLISLKAGGTGLNLTAADIVIHYDPWWNVAAQNQATDRTHRIGQDKQVTVYKLITRNTIEENILNLQEAKRRLADQVVTEGGISLSSLTKEELADMIGPV